MSLQQDMNGLLHAIRAQIATLTSQLAELQTNPPAATPSVEKKFNKKVEVVTDPGAFEGDRARFAEWWIKLQIWVKENWDAFADNFEVATAVLCRLKGPVASQYAQVRLQECYTAGVWPTWEDLKKEIEKYFKPQAERDWARQQIRSFKQGNMRTDDYVTRFLALSIQGGLGNEHAVELLERNMNPRIAEQIYLQDTRNKNLSLAAEEALWVIKPSKSFSRVQAVRAATRAGSPHGYRRGPRGTDAQIQGECYNCGQEGHMSRDCRKGMQAAQLKNNQGRQARQLESEKPDDRLQTLARCSYNKIRAFFYDQQVAEMKIQGKEFGA
ncbi:hypothetical protein SERLA73DRAFT_74108 [Serpula lacrymans var. lacrymans S7.3]|uniref:CCHC-type domain-containing protein n=2 Tax=Serpula lacrymans var. lacrymans TaxID=341189 RepID=F8Q0M1_SERL3|nr:uncharacterized protein SERLADRAFT_438746 [Serpula lacrymans var. lacrymans S7.9]EGN97850.1 hypothetical protein SERLA73DRAFT_74108 [Serpula lacrymans var. lacrymans S7.3]EGO23434.1 hypothetical protein SERLADRAFT_438746 [Serpula lacrymans var. lacrymans S7.9]